MPIITCIGVVFPFVGSLSLDRYHCYLLMILKETLTFLLLSNLVLQYCNRCNNSGLDSNYGLECWKKIAVVTTSDREVKRSPTTAIVG